VVEIQHVIVKLMARLPVQADLAHAVVVFHRWVAQQALPGLLIDVADYRHVHHGPGIVLVGFEADYALDQTGGRLGLLYRRKMPESCDGQTQIERAYQAALAAARRLEREPEFEGQLDFDSGDCEVIFNDRLLVPNSLESYDQVRPVVERAFSNLWQPDSFELERVGEPRDRLRIRVRRLPVAPLQPVTRPEIRL